MDARPKGSWVRRVIAYVIHYAPDFTHNLQSRYMVIVDKGQLNRTLFGHYFYRHRGLGDSRNIIYLGSKPIQGISIRGHVDGQGLVIQP